MVGASPRLPASFSSLAKSKHFDVEWALTGLLLTIGQVAKPDNHQFFNLTILYKWQQATRLHIVNLAELALVKSPSLATGAILAIMLVSNCSMKLPLSAATAHGASKATTRKEHGRLSSMMFYPSTLYAMSSPRGPSSLSCEIISIP